MRPSDDAVIVYEDVTAGHSSRGCGLTRSMHPPGAVSKRNAILFIWIGGPLNQFAAGLHLEKSSAGDARRVDTDRRDAPELKLPTTGATACSC